MDRNRDGDVSRHEFLGDENLAAEEKEQRGQGQGQRGGGDGPQEFSVSCDRPLRVLFRVRKLDLCKIQRDILSEAVFPS